MTKTNKFFDSFRTDSKISTLLHEVRKAQLVTQETKSRLIARTIAFAYEQNDGSLINAAPEFFESEDIKGIVAAYRFTVETILKNFITVVSYNNKTLYAVKSFRDHKKLCDTLKDRNLIKEYYDSKEKEREAAKADKPAQLIAQYSPDNHQDSTGNRIDETLAKLEKASGKDVKTLEAAAVSRNKEKDKASALKYLKDESSELVALRELCAFVTNRGISFREVLNNLQELNS